MRWLHSNLEIDSSDFLFNYIFIVHVHPAGIAKSEIDV